MNIKIFALYETYVQYTNVRDYIIYPIHKMNDIINIRRRRIIHGFKYIVFELYAHHQNKFM